MAQPSKGGHYILQEGSPVAGFILFFVVYTDGPVSFTGMVSANSNTFDTLDFLCVVFKYLVKLGRWGLGGGGVYNGHKK